jgi:RNA polymerase sigma-70 factor, ECF subfamily
MGILKKTNLQNFQQILPFPVEKQPPQLFINTNDADNKLFYIEYYPLVFRRCLAILRNKEEAQDLAHDVFIKVQELKTEGKFNINNPNPISYLFKMAKNMNINKKKRARRELIEIYNMANNGSFIWTKDKGEQEHEIYEAGIIDNGYEKVEAEIIVKAILEEQDETTRKIYLYNYFHDMTLNKIGEAVGLKKSAVQKRLKKLEKQVEAVLRKAEK